MTGSRTDANLQVALAGEADVHSTAGEGGGWKCAALSQFQAHTQAH